MQQSPLPFDTTKYDDLPMSAVIYKPVPNEDGSSFDYIIVYANESLIKDWNLYRSDEPWLGSGTRRTIIKNQELLQLMEIYSKPESFTRSRNSSAKFFDRP